VIKPAATTENPVTTNPVNSSKRREGKKRDPANAFKPDRRRHFEDVQTATRLISNLVKFGARCAIRRADEGSLVAANNFSRPGSHTSARRVGHFEGSAGISGDGGRGNSIATKYSSGLASLT
jgi:hypothetical protein